MSDKREFQHSPVWCTDCGAVVSLTTNWDDDQPIRYECECAARSPAAHLPETWENVRGPSTEQSKQVSRDE